VISIKNTTLHNILTDGQLNFVEVKSSLNAGLNAGLAAGLATGLKTEYKSHSKAHSKTHSKAHSHTKFKIENTLSSTELMSLENSLKEMFLSQINNRRKKRYTKGGKLCASVFVQDKITYFDCTAAKSPDGKNEKKEWCYIDIYARAGKTWDYCKPIIDYDKVREKNQYQLNVITVEARKVNSELLELINEADNYIRELKHVRDGHAELDKQILQIIKSTKALEYNLNYLYTLELKWKNSELAGIALEKLIKKTEESKAKKAKKESTEKKSYYPTDKGTIGKQEDLFNQFINGKVEKRLKIDKVDCDGMDGYTKVKGGSGLKGEYFDNEAWIGKGLTRIDPKIKFTWNGSSPIPGINPYNYSIKWSGFIKAPFTGTYNFHVECNDSVMITFNNRIIIAHNMKTAVPESQGRNNVWMDSEVYIVQHPNIDRSKANSNPTYLIGGNLYRIVISYYHTVHDLLHNEFKAGLQLKWSSNQFAEQIIPEEYFSADIDFPQIQITQFNNEQMVLSTINNNGLIFKNNRNMFYTDVPLEYRGLLSIKMPSRYMGDNITFHTNSPIYVYVAFLAHYPNPLPQEFDDMQQMVQLVVINDDTPVKKVILQIKYLLIKNLGFFTRSKFWNYEYL